jgi:hypothetical protein
MPRMAEDSLRTAIDAIATRLRDELGEQINQLSARHREEVENVRRTAEAEADERWNVKVESVRAEWTARLESEVDAARGEAERRMVAESMRIRVEAEQAAAESIARVRHELEETFAHERDRTASDLAAERQKFTGELENRQREIHEALRQIEALQQERDSVRHERDSVRQERDSLQNERNSLQDERNSLQDERNSLRHEVENAGAARQRAEAALADEQRARESDARRQEQSAAAAAEARVAERQSQMAIVERILGGIKLLDAARSLTQVLSALLTSSAGEAPRVALFVVSGTDLKAWKAEGFGTDAASLQVDAKSGVFSDVLRHREPVVMAGGSPEAPGFAKLPADRAAIAVPLLVGTQAVAVLYADDASGGPPQAPASWPESIQILCRHASANLAQLTAARTAEVVRRSQGQGTAPAPGNRTAQVEDGNSARRYARLLVSEIKLYNEAAVRMGRQKRDLLSRLKPEIERARRLYEQRISSSIDSRGTLFQQELVQTLADGDPALLGGSA